MSTTEATEQVVTEYPVPLPSGTRVRVRTSGGTSVADEGDLGTVVVNDGTYADADNDGLFVKWDEHEKVNYICSPGYGADDVEEFVVVLELPRKQVGTSKDGVPIRVGDILEYIPGNLGWAGVRVEAMDEEQSESRFKFVDTGKLSGYAVGAGVNLQFSDLRHVAPEDPEVPEDSKQQVALLTYAQTGEPVYVGDEVVFIDGCVSDFQGHRGTVTGEPNDANPESVPVETDVSGKWWGVSYVAKVGTPIGGVSYSDGSPVCYGDNVVINPGETRAGTAGIAIGKTAAYCLIKFPGEPAGAWSAGKFSRLQDEDKEKVADDAPKPHPALGALQTRLDLIQGLRGDLSDKISSVNAELLEAEQNDPSVDVSFDEADIRAGVGVSTSNDTLLGLIEYDGSGGLSINDSEVDEHAQDTVSIDTSAIDYTVEGINMEGHLSGLHSAISDAKETLDELLESVDEVANVLGAVLGDEQVTAQAAHVMVTPETETFEGVIHNARIGIVLPEDAETGPALRFDVVGSHTEAVGGDGTKATRRVRLTGRQIGSFLIEVAVSDVKNLEGRTAKLQEGTFGGWWPVAISEVPEV